MKPKEGSINVINYNNIFDKTNECINLWNIRIVLWKMKKFKLFIRGGGKRRVIISLGYYSIVIFDPDCIV